MATVGVVLAACGSTPTATPTATLMALPTSTATTTPRPTETGTPVPPTATATQTPTLAPTQLPHGTPDDAKWRELQSQDYRIVTSAMTSGPEDYVYQVYVLTNPTYHSIMAEFTDIEGGTETGPGICTVLFYRWEGTEYRLVQVMGEKDEPFACFSVNWEDYHPSIEAVQTLGLHGEWSDINANGQPEFAIAYLDCIMCHTYDHGHSAFFEIQSSEKVADLAADLDGSLLPEMLLHAAEPLTIWVYDPWLALGYTIERYQIYAWRNSQYVNVSTEYPSEYQAQLDDVVAKIKAAQAGQPVTGLAPMPSVLEILLLTNTGGLDREAGLNAFLELTNPDTATTPERRCWLQLTRAHAQMDFANGVPFDPYPPLDIELAGGMPLSEQYADLTRNIDTERYDVSACRGDEPTS